MKISSVCVSLQLAALAVGLLASSQPAAATDYVWSGMDTAASGDWLSAKNWKVSNSLISPEKTSSVVNGVGETALKIGEQVSGVPGAGDTATIAAGAIVTISKPLTLAALKVQEGSALQVAGDITVTSTLTLSDAKVSGAGSIIVAENGTAVLSSQKVGDSAGNILGKGIINRGTLTWASGKLALQKDFHNRGRFNVAAAAEMHSAGQTRAIFHNEGTLTKSGASQSVIGLPFKNSGDVYLRGGLLDVGPDYVQSDGSLHLDGGNLKSSGTLQVDGGTVGGSGKLDCDVVNSGTFKPGHSPGFIYISGNYTQTSNGTLGMEVGGPEPGTGYDQMQVSGSAFLAGKLDIIRYNGYTPYEGLHLEFLLSWDIHDTFTSYSGLYPGGSLYYKVIFASDRFYASVYSDNTPPTVSVTNPVNNGTYLGVSSIQGVANDVTYASGVKTVTIFLYRYATDTTPAGYLLADNTWSSTSTGANQLLATGTKTWSRTLPNLAVGKYYVRATAKDNVGRATTTSAVVFTVNPSGSGYVLLPGSPSTRLRLASVLSEVKQ